MSFPIPVKYNLTAEGDATLVIYSDGKELELLPVPSEGGGKMTQELFNQFLTEWVSGEMTFDKAVVSPSNLIYRSISGHTLKELSIFSRLDNIESYAFYLCDKLEKIVLPFFDINSSSTSTFNGCVKLEVADIALSSFPSSTFRDCNNLKKLIIRKNVLVPLANTAVFNNTPFYSGGSGGDIYIPKNIYNQLGSGSEYDYLSNANWNTINSYGTITWHPIEGSEYEFNYADGTPIDSIPVPE